MLNGLKKHLYFIVASYFAFWARIVLWRWKPRIIVITGSTGKTTLFNMVEAQLGDKAIYSHHANSSIGIPFHILGIPANVDFPYQWFGKFLFAPLKIFRSKPQTDLYVVEADCDRPKEGKFISKLLKPEVTILVSVFNTHSMYFDKVVKSGQFVSHIDAIAYEFGHFLERTKKLAIINSDQKEIQEQLKRLPAGVNIEQCGIKALKKFELANRKTIFTIGDQEISLPGLHPRPLAVSLQMVNSLLDYLDLPLDPDYRGFHLPPGRSSLLKGKKNITIIDSTYNSALGSAAALLELFSLYKAANKWLVIGDLLEQGSIEASEHKKLAEVILKVKAEQIILIGPRTREYILPVLQPKLDNNVACFDGPVDVLNYINKHVKGGETILFKGGRSLEGVIELLLADPADEKYLVRRQKYWVRQRQKRGLPR